MKETIADSHVHDGHRSRMRAKLLSHGQKIFDTYELLEMLLYYVIPYKDTNPIAKRLLAAFGGLDGVLSAETGELCTVSGVGNAAAGFLKRVGRVGEFIAAEVGGAVEFSDYHTVGEYLVKYFDGNDGYGVVAMMFDNNMRLLGIERMYDLDYESGGVKCGKFIDAAIRKRASVVISAHYHPHGPFYPSRGDLATNDGLTDALRMAGILHAEHYLISGNKYAGISSIKNFSGKFSQFPAIDVFMSSKAAAISAASELSAVSTEDTCRVSYNRKSGGYSVDFLAELLSPIYKGGSALAERVLAQYHTLEGAMTASVAELTELCDEGFACFIKLLAYVTSRRTMDSYLKNDNCFEHAAVSGYLKALFLGQSVEVAYLLCFDGRGRFIDSAIIGEGTVNSTDVLPRRALEFAIEKSAKSVILAHNHPFGKPTASSDDVKLTNVMDSVFSACDIELLGHYIVAGQRCSTIVLKKD